MDSLITAAAQALASGDALAALNYVSLREDAAALALRGIAMAQLGDLPRAKALLRSAARAFGPHEPLASARCVVAEAEIALVSRDLDYPAKALASAQKVLDRHGDRANAAHAQYLRIRCLVLIGRIPDAERLIQEFDPAPLRIASRGGYELALAGVAVRRLKISAAAAALERARGAAYQAAIPSLVAEVDSAAAILDMPAARLVRNGKTRDVKLEEVELLLASETLVIDACRRVIWQAGIEIGLGSRPILFTLARALAEAWPGGVSRAELLGRAFRAKHVDDSHRARLRVEIGRLRKELSEVALISATKDGFALITRRGSDVAVLAPLTDGPHASVLALLADGEAWSSSALALALGASQRTLQRALDDLLANGKVQAIGQGRARRWMTLPVPGFPTTMLLPTALTIR